MKLKELKREAYAKVIESCEIDGQDEAIIKILRYVRMGYPVLIYGPSGNGKTTVAEHVLAQMGGKDGYVKVEATEGMTEYQLIGGFHPLALSRGEKIFKDGAVTRAIKEGKNLLIDEFTRAPTSAYSGLFLLLSHGTLPLEHEEKVLKKPEDWVVLATANIGDEGTFKVSSALKRRFIPIYMDYPAREVEEKVIRERTPLRDAQVMDAILDFAEDTRRVWREDKAIPQGLSPDGEIKMAQYCELAMREGTDVRTAFLDAAFQQSMVIADESDDISVNLVRELALDIANRLKE